MNHFLSVNRAIILLSLCTSLACSTIDIEYNHDVVGTGSIMTDYRIGDKQSSEASGATHVTGDVLNNLSFSVNNSTNLIITDRFVFTNTTPKAVIMSVSSSYPPWPGNLSRFRLIGKSWADKIELPPPTSIHLDEGVNAIELEGLTS